MKLSLASNIQKFRKESKLTQEQLAETFGVTFAAVSKWERGVATPDLELIASMANLFGISVDKLIGFNMEDNSIAELGKRFDKLVLEQKFEEALELAEEALFRYPNNYDVVHNAAYSYFYIATKTDNKDYYKKTIELLERARLLIPPKSEDTTKNEIVIQGEIAQCYLMLKDIDKAVEILKKNNVNGTYNSLIAYSMTQKKNFNTEEAKPFIRAAISTSVNEFLNSMMSMANYYKQKKEYQKGIESMLWLKEFLNSLKIEPNKTSFFDKLVSTIYVMIANFYIKKNEKEGARKYIELALSLAQKFDLNPTYKTTNIRYIIEDDDDLYVDALGSTAISAVENQIKSSPELNKLWEEMKK